MGCDWEAATSANEKASQILREKGYTQASIDAIQALYDSKMGSSPFGGRDGCVGLKGKCPHAPAVRITCPHKPPFKSCYNCILNDTLGEFKCGCSNKNTIPITQQSQTSPPSPMEDSKSNILIDDDILFLEDVKKEPGVPSTSDITWKNDGTPFGSISDEFGCKYECNGPLENGVLVYRCIKQCAGIKQDRCTAVVRRTLNSKGEKMWLLSIEHNHPVKKKIDDGTSPSGTKHFILINR